MNRMLAIPASCCLLGYVAVFTVLHSGNTESATGSAPRSQAVAAAAVPPPAAPLVATPAPLVSPAPPLLSRADAEVLLHDLQDAYLQPYRKWETSPHRMMSRAGPFRVDPSSAQYDIAQTQSGEYELLGTLEIRFGKKAETYPCVIDRVTKSVAVFAHGKWLTGEQWVETAPMAERRKRSGDATQSAIDLLSEGVR